MEGEESRGRVGCDHAGGRRGARDYIPSAGFGGVKWRDGVDHVAVIEDGEAAVGEVRAPNTKDDVVGG